MNRAGNFPLPALGGCGAAARFHFWGRWKAPGSRPPHAHPSHPLWGRGSRFLWEEHGKAPAALQSSGRRTRVAELVRHWLDLFFNF